MKKSLNVTKRRNRIVALCLLVLMIVTVMIPGADSQAAGKGWEKAYHSFLKNWKQVENYIDLEYVKMYFGKDYKFKRYFVCDVDGNGIPELFLYNEKMNGLSAVLTYQKGKIKGVGYVAATAINKKRRVLVEHGHWHGAGGSGIDEYQIYRIQKKKGKVELGQIQYFDRMPNRYCFSTGDNWTTKKITDKKAKKRYNSLYKKYVSPSISLKKFKKYKFTDKKGLKPQ
ncbi:MAG: hypothetical protein J1F22_04470 [Lachnospiraceae bacterium]|nr:hypothetical protein [Lachnospiraceae bacterium]